mmetsp:Transcript_42439/g.106080  ORF Transcript_42439/g.106080 Transcript_42439/m.106080 type:complete len:274 (-) Transcript_42439:186-1007(-)
MATPICCLTMLLSCRSSSISKLSASMAFAWVILRRRVLSLMILCCITYDAPWNLRSSCRCISHSLDSAATFCCSTWNFLASSALSWRSPWVVLLSMLVRNSCSLSPTWLSFCSLSVAVCFCPSITASLSLSSSSSFSSCLFSFCVSVSCFCSLLRLYSCSSSTRFSSSTLSSNSLVSFCWYIEVLCSSHSTCFVSASFSSLSRCRCEELDWSLSSWSCFSCAYLLSSHSTFAARLCFSFSISEMRVRSLLAMASSSASTSDSRRPIWLLIAAT